jgi:hypothetical protein
MASGQYSRRRGLFWLNSSAVQIETLVQFWVPASLNEVVVLGVAHALAGTHDGFIGQAAAYCSMEWAISLSRM